MEYLTQAEFSELFEDKLIPETCQLIYNGRYTINDEYKINTKIVLAKSRDKDEVSEEQLLNYFDSLSNLVDWDGNRIMLNDWRVSFQCLYDVSYYQKRYMKFLRDLLKKAYMRVMLMTTLGLLKKLKIEEIDDMINLDKKAYNFLPLFRKWLQYKEKYPETNYTINYFC